MMQDTDWLQIHTDYKVPDGPGELRPLVAEVAALLADDV